MTKKIQPLASLTIRHKDGKIVTIEIHRDAGHNDFFHWYRSTGRGRRREHFRTSGRTITGSLETLAAKAGLIGQATRITIRNKKLYNQFMTCSPDQLPGKPVISRVNIPDPSWRTGEVRLKLSRI